MSDPNAARTLLLKRADVLSRIRSFFAARGVVEVDTPALSAAGISDPTIESVRARVFSLTPADQYLHTSPELAMKRLLASVRADIYQICRVFRDRELGRWHQPEFVMLEWYRTGYDELELMDEVGELLGYALRADDLPCRRMTYADAFGELGVDPHERTTAAQSTLEQALLARGVEPPRGMDHDALLDLGLSTLIVPTFDPGIVTFIHDYPATQSALAEIKARVPPVAARFEAFLGGLELANGFRELTDSGEQKRRFEADLDRRRARGLEAPPIDRAFLAALERGLPACAGVALGIDRLVAVALGAQRLADAVTFPH